MEVLNISEWRLFDWKVRAAEKIFANWKILQLFKDKYRNFKVSGHGNSQLGTKRKKLRQTSVFKVI